MFQVKAGYDLKLLTLETIKLLGSSKYKINKDKNVENGSHLEITNNDIEIQEFCMHLSLIKHLASY